MSLTFEEAAERLRVAIPENFVSPTMHDIAVMAETQDRVIYELRNTYAPIIEMTQAQYDIFNSALADSKESENDFIYFIDNLDTQSHFYSDIFGKELSAFRNNSRYFMQAWLHPECIKVVE